ncbi:cation diffusion facilitator family transporter [Campylobacter sp. 19-13652]|uniref:cation diffusion facilitator family transporter n=1 Tax=Campylobacter sp. 19-13652 TaxID=2840180 RepID=UPI001C794457|nr:cation diffusion facilitator family transporter [Campylobacter sp. 19-13652]BCX78613.1 hypothetical protein LBC_00750 [Campylobacter sp. 19-13652]
MKTLLHEPLNLNHANNDCGHSHFASDDVEHTHDNGGECDHAHSTHSQASHSHAPSQHACGDQASDDGLGEFNYTHSHDAHAISRTKTEHSQTNATHASHEGSQFGKSDDHSYASSLQADNADKLAHSADTNAHTSQTSSKHKKASHKFNPHTRASHSHAHGTHAHADPRSTDKKLLIAAIALTATMAIIELIYSLISGSLSLLSDTLHMFSDTLALALSLLALHLAQRLKSKNLSFGYYRLEVLASFTNALTILLSAAFIGVKAIERLLAPQSVDAGAMLPVAIAGLVINLIAAAIMAKGSNSLNMRSALLHIIADLLGSVAVIAGALAMMMFGIYWLDALLAILISASLLRHSVQLLKQSGFILLEGSTCDLDEIKNTLLQNENIASIDDLHVTQITENMLVASMHVRLFSGVKFEKVSDFISLLLLEKYGIAHTTIQPCWKGE